MERMTSTALSVTGLTKHYGRRAAVDRSRHRVALRSGRRICRPERRGQDHDHGDVARARPTIAGSGTVLGSSINEPAEYLPRVGAMIESPAFYPSLSGAENLRMFATVGAARHRVDTVAARRRRARRIEATTGTATTHWA